MIHSMRLSLMKGALADLSSTAGQEIGVKPAFGLEWDTTALDPPSFRMFFVPPHRIVILPAPACRGRGCDFIDFHVLGIPTEA